MKRYQIETNSVADLLSKVNSLSVKNSLPGSVRGSRQKELFTKEFLKQQFQQPKQAKRQLSNSELVVAMQKYHQLVQSKKEPRSNSKSSALLNQLVTKVAPQMDLKCRPLEVKSHRPSTSDTKLLQQFQHKRQASNGGTKESVLKKLQSALQPKSQSQQVTPVSSQERKFFEASKHKGPYYLGKIRQAFTKPLQEDYFSRIYRDHYFQTYQGIYVASFLKPADPTDLKTKQVKLKKQDFYKGNNYSYIDKITLIFDLDETLVHCNESTQIPCDVMLTIQINIQEQIKAGINIRPGATQFLESLVNDFEIIVFTASHSCYAQKVIDHIDPTGKLVSHRLFRDNCIMTTGGMYTKDLRIFDRPLSQVVLIDNAAYSYAWQIDNGIPIIPFYDNKEDRELDSLRQYLMGMVYCKDVRQYNKEHLKLHQFNDNQGPAVVFEKLFNQKMEI